MTQLPSRPGGVPTEPIFRHASAAEQAGRADLLQGCSSVRQSTSFNEGVRAHDHLALYRKPHIILERSSIQPSDSFHLILTFSSV